jgi:MFS family permease
VNLSSPRSTSVEDHNFYHLVVEVAWFGIAWVTVARFLSVYAIRIGATPTEQGWIVAGPAICMMLTSLFTVWWRNRFPSSVTAMWWPTLLFRLIFLMLAFTPLLPPRWQPLWLIVSVMLPGLAQGFSNVIFWGIIKESTPQSRMTSLLGQRTLAVNLTLSAAALTFGLLLEKLPYPVNYMLMFIVAFVAALMSMWHLNKVRPLFLEETKPLQKSAPAEPTIHPLRVPAFRNAVIVAGLSYLSFFATFPVLPMRLMNELGAGEGMMGFYALIELMAAAAVAVFMVKIVKRLGNTGMVGVSLVATAIGSLWVSVAPSATWALLAGVFIGAGWSTAEIGLFGLLTEVMPVRDAARYTRLFSQTSWIAIFIAPFIGTQLVELGVPLTQVLLFGAVLRGLAGLAVLFLFSSRIKNAILQDFR